MVVAEDTDTEAAIAMVVVIVVTVVVLVADIHVERMEGPQVGFVD